MILFKLLEGLTKEEQDSSKRFIEEGGVFMLRRFKGSPRKEPLLIFQFKLPTVKLLSFSSLMIEKSSSEEKEKAEDWKKINTHSKK